MTLPAGADAYVKAHAKDERDAKIMRDAFYAGYFLSTQNWCTKARK